MAWLKTLGRAVSRADKALAVARALAAHPFSHADAASLAPLPFSRARAVLPFSNADAGSLAPLLFSPARTAFIFSHADAASLSGPRNALSSFRVPKAAPMLSPWQSAVLVSISNAPPLAGSRGILIIAFRDPDAAPAQSLSKPTVISKISKSGTLMLHRNFGSSAQHAGGTSSSGIGPLGPDGLPVFVDWVLIGAVTPVSNQGHCGSCWAFASTVCTEGVNFIVTGHLLKLSEQQLIDCVNINSFGCCGGNPEAAFHYIIENRGQVLFDHYPYMGVQNPVHYPIMAPGVTLDGYQVHFDVDEQMLKTFVANQPVVVAVGVDAHFEGYTHGVLDGKNYTDDEMRAGTVEGKQLGHWVAIVDYGVETDGRKFWRAKNSWGPDWGEGGYIKIARDTGKEGGAFGICRSVYFPEKHSPNRYCIVQNEDELGMPKWNY